MFQFTVAQISNGFIVQHPDFSAMARMNLSQAQQGPPPPKTQFCSDFDEVIAYLKTIWPVTITG